MQAQTNTNSWISTSPDNWSTGPSWSLGAVPNSDQAVFITNGSRVTASFGSAAYSLTLGGASGNSEFTVGIGATLAATTDFTLAPGAGGGILRLNGGTITLGGGAGKVLNGGGAGVALFSLGGNWTNSMGWSEANVDSVSQAFGATNTLIITNGQIYNILDQYQMNTSVSSGSAGRAGLVIDGGTLNLGDTVGSGAGQLRFNHGNNADNVSYVDLNSNGVIRAELITRINAGADAAINWNDGTIGNYAGTDLTISASAGTMKLVLAGTGTHTFEAESGQTITVASTALLEDKAGEAGTLNKTGAGTLRINSASTYTGATTISAGSLVLGNTGSVAGSSVLDVASGATLDVSLVTGGFTVGTNQTLRGGGSVVGNTTINGALQPGSSPGLLSFSNNLTLGGTAVTTMEIEGDGTGGTDFDAVNVGSLLTYDGTLSLFLGTTFAEGAYTFDLFDFGSQSGSFDTVELGGLYAGSLTNNGSGVWGLASGNETWTFTQSSGVLELGVVPEPSTYALLALSAAGLGAHVFARRRKR